MDGFVTSHIALHQGLSKAYRLLANFETDGKRKQAMHSRRAQSLEPILKSLGMKAYSHLHKELSFELGEVYEELADFKRQRLEEKLKGGQGASPQGVIKPADVRKMNELYQVSVDYFSHFVDMYHKESPGGGQGGERNQEDELAKVEDGEVGPYLQARFRRARLLGKLQFAESAKTAEALQRSRNEFLWLVDHAPARTKDLHKEKDRFQEELKLAKQMAELQLQSIDRLMRA
ncbi:unnamed protein product [Discosporangium mesarthrocarpum]